MTPKEKLKVLLERARGASERMLADFKTPQQWTHQVCPGANHAMWFAGHMASVDNFFISFLSPDKKIELPGYQEKFGMGSTPVDDPAAYPAPEEVFAKMKDRRAALMSVLDRTPDADLDKPTPPGAPDFMKDIGSTFELLAWHEGVHTGQLSVARRSLGHQPIFTRPAPKETV
jgi:uncharacterized damage-inducible protein DinB